MDWNAWLQQLQHVLRGDHPSSVWLAQGGLGPHGPAAPIRGNPPPPGEYQPGQGYGAAAMQGVADALPGLARLLQGDWHSALYGSGDTRIAEMGGKGAQAVPAVPEAPKVADLTRPWVGIYKGAPSEGHTVPKSYTAPKTYDLTDYFQP